MRHGSAVACHGVKGTEYNSPCLRPSEGGHHYPTHLEPGILALGSITMNKASEGDGIPVELFQILKDDAVKVLYSLCQQIWKTQQWPQGWKRSVFIPIPKKGNAKARSNYQTSALTSQASILMLKILQVRLQQYMNRELPDVQVGFRKGRGARDQIANICWIIEKEREFQKNIFFCFIDYAKAFDCVDHNKLWKILKWPQDWKRPVSFQSNLKERQC